MPNSKKVILISSLAVFLFCILYLGIYYYKDYKVENDVSSLRKVVRQNENNERKSEKEEKTKSESDVEKTPTPKYAQNGMLYAYADLADENEDMVGWVRIPNTKIDYPVMYNNQSNEYYLHRNFEKKYSDNGLPYLDYQCDLSRPSTNLIIYGHNMRSGSMFAALTKYDEKEYYNKHRFILFDTLYEEHEYEIFSVFTTVVGKNNEFRYNEFIDIEAEEEFNKFISLVKSNQYYETGVDVKFGDSLLTLSTCSYNEKNERTVVVAKRIK